MPLILCLAKKCKPMTSLMPNLPATCRHYVFDACAGLSGSETLNEYPCILDPQNARFYVWLGDTDLALFTKSTFMNLSNFAESAGARTVIFLIFHAHRQMNQYKNLFRVIDAHRLRTDAFRDLIGGGIDRQSAKSILAATLFYELAL